MSRRFSLGDYWPRSSGEEEEEEGPGTTMARRWWTGTRQQEMLDSVNGDDISPQQSP